MKSSLSLIDLHLPDISKRVSIMAEHGFYFDEYWFDLKNHRPFASEKYSLSVSIQQLVDELTKQLYLRCFCGVVEVSEGKPLPPLNERQAFMGRLTEANHGSKSPDRDWQVVETDDFGLSYAEKNGVKRPMHPETFTHQKKHPGRVDFIRTGEDRFSTPTTYYALSDVYFHGNYLQTCFYWNISYDGVAQLLNELTGAFNFYKIPYQFSCPNHPDLYREKGAVMLLVDRQDQCLALQLMPRINDRISGFLNEGIPLFTTRLSLGFSKSEVPVDGMPYGKYMMRQVAERLVGEAIWGNEYTSELTGKDTMLKAHKTGQRLILG